MVANKYATATQRPAPKRTGALYMAATAVYVLESVASGLTLPIYNFLTGTGPFKRFEMEWIPTTTVTNRPSDIKIGPGTKYFHGFVHPFKWNTSYLAQKPAPFFQEKISTTFIPKVAEGQPFRTSEDVRGTFDLQYQFVIPDKKAARQFFYSVGGDLSVLEKEMSSQLAQFLAGVETKNVKTVENHQTKIIEHIGGGEQEVLKKYGVKIVDISFENPKFSANIEDALESRRVAEEQGESKVIEARHAATAYKTLLDVADQDHNRATQLYLSHMDEEIVKAAKPGVVVVTGGGRGGDLGSAAMGLSASRTIDLEGKVDRLTEQFNELMKQLQPEPENN